MSIDQYNPTIRGGSGTLNWEVRRFIRSLVEVLVPHEFDADE